MRKLLPLVSLFALSVCAAGCARPDQPVAVSGTVTFDGKEVEEGHIIFTPERTELRRTGGPIKDGRFTCEAWPGKNRVEITASRPDPKQPGPGGAPTHVEYIPAQYNEQSKLTEEVKSTGANEFQFKLKSQ